MIAGMGLLPCPLTISVLGFAWIQSNGVMVGVVLVALALGIALTIGVVAVLTVMGRQSFGYVFARWGDRFEHGARVLQGGAGVLVVVLSCYALAKAMV